MMAESTGEIAEARCDAKLLRILKQDRRPYADPLIRGSDTIRNGFASLNSAEHASRCLWRWNTQGRERHRMTGNIERTMLVEADQFWLCFSCFFIPMRLRTRLACSFIVDSWRIESWHFSRNFFPPASS